MASPVKPDSRESCAARVLGSFVLVMVLAGCSEIDKGAESSASTARERDAGYVSRTTLGDQWPLRVEEGVLHCDGADGFGAVTITADGVTFALNGTARGRKQWPDVDPIWASSDIDKKDIGVLIDEGLKLCK